MSKIAIGGALGRMGRANLRIASGYEGLKVAAGWERPGHPDKGKDLGELAGLGHLGARLSDDPAEALKGVDAAIDFSTPAATLAALQAAAAVKPIPFVIGTTGMTPGEKAQVAAYARLAPVIHSSNFSIGVNVLWKIAAEAAKVTGDDYDLEVLDLHHHHKKDAPSGTAVTTAEILAAARGHKYEDVAVFGRHTRDDERKPGQIGIHALRAGDVVGDHTIYLAGPYERLELTHRAHARENFASGAVRAAWWLLEKKKGPGMYSMAQVLGLAP